MPWVQRTFWVTEICFSWDQVQGYQLGYTDAYVSDNEIKDIVKFINTNNESSYIDSLLDSSQEDEYSDISSDDDPLYQEALNTVMETQKTSISFLQRKLRIGYNRAANLIETMESRGVLSSQQPNGTREILNQK